MIKNRTYLSKVLSVICSALIIGIYTWLNCSVAYADPSDFLEVWQQQKTILLDPGHGGMDGGASSKTGLLEKDINLKIGLKTKELLEREGYKILMTREEDKWLCTEGGTIRKRKLEDLENRYKFKKESGCDMFISIHLNAFPQSKYYGAQVWYGENQSSKIMGRLLQKTFRESLDNNNDRIEKPARNSYKILRDNGEIPAVLAECGFLSNPEEAAKLNDEAYQEKIAEVIVQAVNIYFGSENDIR